MVLQSWLLSWFIHQPRSMDIWEDRTRDPTREDVRQLTVWGSKAWLMRLWHVPCGETSFCSLGQWLWSVKEMKSEMHEAKLLGVQGGDVWKKGDWEEMETKEDNKKEQESIRMDKDRSSTTVDETNRLCTCYHHRVFDRKLRLAGRMWQKWRYLHVSFPARLLLRLVRQIESSIEVWKGLMGSTGTVGLWLSSSCGSSTAYLTRVSSWTLGASLLRKLPLDSVPKGSIRDTEYPYWANALTCNWKNENDNTTCLSPPHRYPHDSALVFLLQHPSYQEPESAELYLTGSASAQHISSPPNYIKDEATALIWRFEGHRTNRKDITTDRFFSWLILLISELRNLISYWSCCFISIFLLEVAENTPEEDILHNGQYSSHCLLNSHVNTTLRVNWESERLFDV